MDIIPSDSQPAIIENQEAYTEFIQVLASVCKGVKKESQRIYTSDGRKFGAWMQARGLTPYTLNRDHMRDYRSYLIELYKPATAQRMWFVVRKIIHEYLETGRLAQNPIAENDKGQKFHAPTETTHTILTKDEAEKLLHQVDQDTLIGKRNYAILQILLRIGLRRRECASLVIGNLHMDQGHYVIDVLGKGDKPDTVKLPVDVYRHIMTYLEACGISFDITRQAERNRHIDALPLFCRFKRNGEPTIDKGITGATIYHIVTTTAEKMGSEVSPHGLRATLITYLLGIGEPLHKVQYAVRHSRPETTERYDRRKKNLDDSPLDRFHLG